MPLDGVTTYLLSEELNSSLNGARVDKIYQPDKKSIILLLRAFNKNSKLLLSADPDFPRVHITDVATTNPSTPPGFCMVLRKYLSGSRISRISSPGFERIIEIEFSSVDEIKDNVSYRLIIEMMGRYSNIILLNQDKRIIDSIFHVDAQMSRVREVMPARPYDYPPSQNKLSPLMAVTDLENRQFHFPDKLSGRPAEKAILETFTGISPYFASEICTIADIDGKKCIADFNAQEYDNLCNVLISLFVRIKDQVYSPGVFFKINQEVPYDFHALIFPKGLRSIKTDSISKAIDLLVVPGQIMNDFYQKKHPLIKFAESGLAHAVRKHNVHLTDLSDSEDYETLKLLGDLLLTNQYAIPSKSKHFICQDYSDPPQQFTIELDENLSPTDNAQRYYRKYRKAKTKYDKTVSFLKEDELAIEYFKSLLNAATQASDISDLLAVKQEIEWLNTKDQSDSKADANINHPGKSKTGKQKSRAIRAAMQAAKAKSRTKPVADNAHTTSAIQSYRTFELTGGELIMCGRNNIQNDFLTFKVASKDDYWFHAKNIPGSHVILRNFGQIPSDQVFEISAAVAAYYSSANTDLSKGILSKDTPNYKIEVDYCMVKHVKKIPGSKPGMVTYSHFNTMLIQPSLPSNER
ncbi:MAG: fibronectin/fibrinogen-binding protein [Clostridiaceae bacterium]|nr:fibronectin/fibrinogen-binding protein [Clostridiaceae bacterium]